jgi:hypothetical protein
MCSPQLKRKHGSMKPHRSLRAWRFQTLSENPWSLPDGPIVLEGRPTPEEQARWSAEYAAALSAWTPGTAGEALVNELRAYIGFDLVVWPWDLMIWLLGDDPNPFLCRLIDVEVGAHENGKPRALLVVEAPIVIEGRMEVPSELEPRGTRYVFDLGVASELEVVEGKVARALRRPRAGRARAGRGH